MIASSPYPSVAEPVAKREKNNERYRTSTRRVQAADRSATMLPSADTAAMLFSALLASGQIDAQGDGWQALATKPVDQPLTSQPETILHVTGDRATPNSSQIAAAPVRRRCILLW